MKIQDEKFYKPNEIVKFGLTKAKTESTQRQMILRKIKEKKLNAINVGSELKPRYVVQGRHIKDYLDRQVKHYSKK